jgi:hypothetical protein
VAVRHIRRVRGWTLIHRGPGSIMEAWGSAGSAAHNRRASRLPAGSRST